jgi:hypothetical protein
MTDTKRITLTDAQGRTIELPASTTLAELIEAGVDRAGAMRRGGEIECGWWRVRGMMTDPAQNIINKMERCRADARDSRTSQPPFSAFVGKTVEDEEMGRGRIIDETPSCVGVRYNRERNLMRVHYIPKRCLTPNASLNLSGDEPE